MYNTDIKWNNNGVTVIVGAEAPIIIRLSNDEAETLYMDMSMQAADPVLYNQAGSFTVGTRAYDFTAEQWASVHDGLEAWYAPYFDAIVAGDLFDSLPDTAAPLLSVVN